MRCHAARRCWPTIVPFVEEVRAEGFAVESICRVLCEQRCQVAERTYRSWRVPSRTIAGRILGDALVVDTVRDIAWAVDPEGLHRLTPEWLYGCRKMTALVQRRMPQASPGSVGRVMRSLALQGIRRSKGIRATIPSKDGKRAGDLLDRDLPPLHRTAPW